MRADVYATPAPVTARLCEAIEQAVSRGKRSSLAKPLSSPALPPSPVCETATLPDEAAPSRLTTPSPIAAQLPWLNQNDVQQNGHSTDVTRQTMVQEVSPSLAEAGRSTSPRKAPEQPEEVESCSEDPSGRMGDSTPACRVCLGILQSLDGPLQAVAPELLPHLSERDGGGAPWSPVEHGDAAGIADHIKCALLLAT